jgi:hypothetical protein
MSTEINIKKRIDIQEEGVSITPDVNSINFIGDGVTASAIGDDVTVNIPGGTGTVTYYLNESVTQAPYKEFTSILTASPEQTILTSIASGATVTIQSFQTPSGVPGTTNIPGGRWAFYLHFSGTTGDSWDVFADVYKRDLGGIETLLLTTDAVPTSTLTGAAVMLLTDGVFPASTVLTTDRIVVKVRVTNTDSTTNSITFHTEGNTNYSVATTTLNQVIPTGAVTSVTGTAPIASSGGTTPAISISQSGAASDGYLSSTDWNTFNNKVDDNIYTADGTLGGNRTVTMNTNTITFDGTDSDVKYTPNSAGGYLQLEGKASAVPRFSVSIPPYLAQPVAGFQLGMRAWDDAAFPGYGKVGDAFFYAGNATNGLNFLNPVGVGTEDYIRFYAGELATAISHIHIQGTGATKGNVGIGTETPTEKLDVAGKTKTTTFQLTTTPTAGYVLTSDASGNGTWQTPPVTSGVFGIANTSGVYTYYATLTLAMAAAVAGQTIEMFADVTETGAVTINLKNGVNINGNGHSYTLSNTGTVSCLSDNGVAVTCSITDLTLNRIGSTSQSITNTTCLLVTGASRIDFTGSKAFASNATSVIVNNSGAIVSNVYAYGASGAQAATTIYVNAGRLENSTAYNNANNAGFFVYGLQNLGTIVNCIAHQTSGHPAILSSGIMIDCVGYSTSTGAGVRNAGIGIGSTGYSSGGAGFIADVNTTNQSCNGYSSGGRGFEISGSANCRVMNCSGFSTAGYGILAYNSFVQNSTAHSTSTNGLYLSNAGDGFGSISNCTITSDAAAALFCNPSSLMSVSNSTMLSRWNNAAGHAAVLGLTVFSGAPFVDFFNNTFIVSNASANCLNSANAVSVRYASSVFRNSTTPVNANITQLVTNTEDNQGNILI